MGNSREKEDRAITICLGSSCFIRGNKTNLEAIRKYLETNSLDAEVSFSGRFCEEMCNRGPVITIGEKVYENVDLSRLYKILQEEFPC